MNLHDEEYAKVLFTAMNDTHKPYDLFLGYFGDVDARSHQHGAMSER